MGDWSSGTDSNIYWDITIQMVSLDRGHTSTSISGHLDETPLYFWAPALANSFLPLLRYDRRWDNRSPGQELAKLR